MNIAIIGYGKMGKEIEAIARVRGHRIALIIDVNNHHELTPKNLKQCDAAIEFTSPQTALSNVMSCIASGTPVVCGSTGWLAQMDEVKQACSAHNGTFFYASNYSVGVNLFFRINKILAAMMSGVQGYAVSMEEIHHTEKKDAPSGTAITLAEYIMMELKGVSRWVNSAEHAAGELPIVSLREPDVPGTHTVCYNSDVDSITLTHAAKSRKGFALGAVLAAEFIQGKRGCYSMEDMLPFSI